MSDDVGLELLAARFIEPVISSRGGDEILRLPSVHQRRKLEKSFQI
jgi:hypothetical protein